MRREKGSRETITVKGCAEKSLQQSLKSRSREAWTNPGSILDTDPDSVSVQPWSPCPALWLPGDKWARAEMRSITASKPAFPLLSAYFSLSLGRCPSWPLSRSPGRRPNRALGKGTRNQDGHRPAAPELSLKRGLLHFLSQLPTWTDGGAMVYWCSGAVTAGKSGWIFHGHQCS